MIYEKIYEFCKVKEKDQYNIGKDFSNRARFIMNLLDELSIAYIVDSRYNHEYERSFHNIYLMGNSNKYISAHYDIINTESDNANDNSASVINAIAYKLFNPSINVLILDGEEPPYMGAGSLIASNYLKSNNKDVEWILNLELTGKGRGFITDNVPTRLKKNLMLFDDITQQNLPKNDAVIFRDNGIPSNVLTTVDYVDGEPDISIIFNCHTKRDSVDTISTADMKHFVEKTLPKIIED